MKKVIHCPCGYDLTADTEEALVAAAQQHAKESHGMELTTEQALAMAEPADS